MKGLRYICIGLLAVWMGACGEIEEPEMMDESIQIHLQEPVQKQQKKEEIEEETFYSVNEVIPYDESISVLGRLKAKCELSDLGHQCVTKLSDVRSKDMPLSKTGVIFKKPGMYLVEENDAPKLMKIVAEETPAIDFEIYAFKDSFYHTLYHFDLIFFEDLKNRVLDVSWQVEGGRFHFYDEELQYLKRARPLQKTILFLEKKIYEISVTLQFSKKDSISKKITLDLSKGFDEDQNYQLKAFYQNAKNAIQLLSDLKESASQYYQWQLNRLENVFCDPSIRYLETSPDVKKICDRFYVHRLIRGVHYELQKPTLKSALLILNDPGNYLIHLEVTNAQNELLYRLSQKLRHE